VLGRLFLLFTLVPLAELYLLVKIGSIVGVAPTIALVAVTGMLGAYLAKREGQRALASYQAALSKGQLPEEGIVSGLLILAGGVMLITPGVLTDFCGLMLMIPPVRRGVAGIIKRRMAGRIASGEVRVMHIGGAGFGGDVGYSGPGPGGVVDVEVVETRDPAAGPASLERRG
jgi:UPF0716 protein FxsA